MDGSRRSFDRSREPGTKKPRLAAEEQNARPFPIRSIGAGSNQIQSRYERDTDINDPSSGGGYQPQPLPSHQQHQELLEQYRTALAELTFNSKPIITNLTIIAGENVHAAKAIASIICDNILEVPSDQKLPSLYLLDSIVKNIGRDYIKYFAVRLPEVFCRAYRQVDSPIHSSMRHLFGTWKGVFHPQMLQIIEKELGFGTSSNGSSASASSRSESQSQRPPHSIHVNPKYLERQRLQQSVQPKVIADDMDMALVSPSEDMEKLDRQTGFTGGRTWASTAKMQRSHRDPRIDHLQDKNNIGVVYGDYEYGSDISRNSGLGTNRTGGKVTEQKPWYGVSSGSAADTVPSQRNGYPARHKVQSSPSPKTSHIDSQINRSVGGMSTNWKNSEEEEFLWDSIDPKPTEHDARIARKDLWTPDVSDKLDIENSLPKTLSREAQSRLGPVGASSRSSLSDGYPARVSAGISLNSLSRRGMGPQGRSSYTRSPSLGSSASFSGNNGHQPVQSLATPAAQSPIRPSSVDMARHPQMNSKSSQFSSKSSLSQSDGYIDDSLKIPSDVKLGSVKRLQPRKTKIASPPMTILPEVSEHGVALSVRDSLPESSMPPSLETCGQLNDTTSTLLAALVKSGSIPINTILGNLPGKALGMAQGSSRALHDGMLSNDLLLPIPKSEPSSVLATCDATLTAVDVSQGKIISSEPEESPSTMKNDPISSLLSSLVARGLISSSKTESPSSSSPTRTLAPAVAPAQTAKLLVSVKQEEIFAIPQPISAKISTEVPVLATVDKASVPEPVSENSDQPQLPAVKEDIIDLIGCEFKPEVIRQFHTSVISYLFDELPYKCGICGMRFKLNDILDRHLVWHTSLNPEQTLAAGTSSKWYTHSSHWVAGRTGPNLSGPETIKVEEESCCDTSMAVEMMVPADESQCACVLCGELFEDFYDLGKDEWMFKGAVYMSIPYEAPKLGAESDNKYQGPIVHANCLLENSVLEPGMGNIVKMEEDG
ncbi:hypothetical protein SAY87_026747 [Trapa incisa]|uniref:CID domain-containing protein n=1 Tax=Trapa incisa TaxID=236973 RepID=A0AAN7GYB5_9MYRT|nr:hypothetical protein SAY87_026747 [Trapa incisa]